MSVFPSHQGNEAFSNRTIRLDGSLQVMPVKRARKPHQQFFAFLVGWWLTSHFGAPVRLLGALASILSAACRGISFVGKNGRAHAPKIPRRGSVPLRNILRRGGATGTRSGKGRPAAAHRPRWYHLPRSSPSPAVPCVHLTSFVLVCLSVCARDGLSR